MSAQTIPDSVVYQQTLNRIIETLPVERIQQIVDYARFLQSQASEDETVRDADNLIEAGLDSDPLDLEVQFFETQHGELVKDYLGQHIAMLAGEVIASHSELDTLITEVRKSHPEGSVLFRLVEESLPPTIIFRSPRMLQP